MKSFSTVTETAFDNPTVEPLRLLEITMGATTLYFCDRTFGSGDSFCTFDSNTYEPLVISWESIKAGKIDPQTYETDIADAAFTINNTVPTGGQARFSAHFAVTKPHYCSVEIFEIPNGASSSDDKNTLFVGKIEDILEMRQEFVSVRCSGFEIDIINKFSHTIITADVYSGADPDDIGKMAPQIYGSVKRSPCIAVDAGGKTTITEDMTDSSPGDSGTLDLTDGSAFPTGAFILQVDSEQISIASRSGNTLTLAGSGARGYDSTDAVDHDAGAHCAEIQTAYVYLAADHPVSSVDNVYVDGVRVTTGFTAYTGQSGDEYSGYEGLAVVVFDALQTFKKQVNVDVDSSGLGVDSSGRSTSDSGHTHAGDPSVILWPFQSATPSNPTVVAGEYSMIDGDWSQYGSIFGASAYIDFETNTTISYPGTPTHVKVGIRTGTLESGTSGTLTFCGASVTCNTSNTTATSSWTVLSSSYDTWAEIQAAAMRIQENASYNIYRVIEVWAEIKYTPETGSDSANVYLSGSNTITGTVTSFGNSTAETVIGSLVSVDCDGRIDDGSGTYTGTPDALIERSDHILKHILIAQCGLTSSQLNSASYTAAGTFQNSNSYVLGFSILQRPNVRELINSIAVQSKMLEFWDAGEHYLEPIESETRDKLITGVRVDQGQIYVSYTDRIKIENKIVARYNHHWSGYIDQLEADRDAVETEDSTSQTAFGILQNKTHTFTHITAEAQAQDVIDWFKDDLKQPRLMVDFSGGYWLSDLQVGDIVGFNVEDSDDYITDALFGLITDDAEGFRIIEKTYRADATIQLKAISVGTVST